MASRRRSGGRASRKGYYWDGVQWPNANISATGTELELVNPIAQEFMPSTLVRIRGFVQFSNTGSDAATGGADLGAKILYVEVNDAGAVTGDHAAIDTHEEDIARRQLWTYFTRFPAGGSTSAASETVRIEVDVRVKIKLEASGKNILLLLLQATNSNRIATAGYLRCLLLHG